jgi:hypothetical protein
MPHNLIRVKDRVPRSGKGSTNLLTQLGQYLTAPENRYVQKIVIEAEQPILYFEKLVPKEEVPPEAGMTFHDAIRVIPMEEVGFDVGTSPHPLAYIHELFLKVTRNGFEVGQILIGGSSQVYEWLGLPRASERLFGVPIAKIPEIPNDVVIACASRTRVCDPEDVEFSVKVAIP